MTAGPVFPDAMASKRAGLCAARPGWYIVLILCAALGAYGYKLKTEGIFACPATGYAPDWYLAYCHADGYGDYEHGVFGFDLESAGTIAAGATTLFLGSSRMQHALSTKTMASWFSSAALTYYLMGFGYTENVVFAREVLRRIKPQARVYIINVDGFFEETETPPARIVLQDSTARIRYAVKGTWQFFHRGICQAFPSICGNNYVIFRSRSTGDYRVWGRNRARSPAAVSYDPAVDNAEADSEIAVAKAFLQSLPVKNSCVILTMVPTVKTKLVKAKAIAAALDMDLVAPHLEGLRTYDGSHLDNASAEQWSRAFLDTAAPRIRECVRLNGTAAAPTAIAR